MTARSKRLSQTSDFPTIARVYWLATIRRLSTDFGSSDYGQRLSTMPATLEIDRLSSDYRLWIRPPCARADFFSCASGRSGAGFLCLGLAPADRVRTGGDASGSAGLLCGASCQGSRRDGLHKHLLCCGFEKLAVTRFSIAIDDTCTTQQNAAKRKYDALRRKGIIKPALEYIWAGCFLHAWGCAWLCGHVLLCPARCLSIAAGRTVTGRNMAACAGHEKARRNSAGWMLLHVTESGKNESGQ